MHLSAPSRPKSLNLLLAVLLLIMQPVDARAQDRPIDQPSGTVSSSLDDDYLWDEEEEEVVFDPFEPVNRAIFWFNDKLYFYLLKPIARTYRVVPEPARESVGRAFSNLGTPVRFVNSTLQLKLQKAGTELTRFVINSTIGLLGLFDPARDMGLKKHDEDFGQTLGHYGAGPGFYLVLPVFGPSNLRDGIGRIGDMLVDPISSPYYFKLKQEEVIGLKVFDLINTLSLDKDTYEGIKRDALDPYLYVRNSFLQHRAAKVEE
jgi:phospholipid-binding lipoprotein MlaA